MPMRKLRDYLDRNRIDYSVVAHKKAYTAQEVAETSHIPGHEIAKTVIVKIDGTMAMAVLPASEVIDLELLEEMTGAMMVELADEGEFSVYFKDCETGAMPPFGNLFGMKVYVDPELALDKTIAFNAGNHTELIRMKYLDFERLVEPIMLEFGVMA